MQSIHPCELIKSPKLVCSRNSRRLSGLVDKKSVFVELICTLPGKKVSLTFHFIGIIVNEVDKDDVEH